MIGTYNSGCAAIEIPILGEARRGDGLAGQHRGLPDRAEPDCEDGQPESLYPSGTRNYARVVPNDAFQGAGLASFAEDSGVGKPVRRSTPPTTRPAPARRRTSSGAAERARHHLAGFETWDPKAKNYTSSSSKVDRRGADAVVLAGLTEQNGAQLIKDKVEVLGSNSEVAADRLRRLRPAVDDRRRRGRPAGCSRASPAAPRGPLGRADRPGPDLEAGLGGAPVEQFAPYAGEAAAVLVDAIGSAGADRAAVVDAVYATEGGGGSSSPTTSTVSATRRWDR